MGRFVVLVCRSLWFVSGIDQKRFAIAPNLLFVETWCAVWCVPVSVDSSPYIAFTPCSRCWGEVLAKLKVEYSSSYSTKRQNPSKWPSPIHLFSTSSRWCHFVATNLIFDPIIHSHSISVTPPFLFDCDLWYSYTLAGEWSSLSTDHCQDRTPRTCFFYISADDHIPVPVQFRKTSVVVPVYHVDHCFSITCHVAISIN